jgi:hypothetical protein
LIGIACAISVLARRRTASGCDRDHRSGGKLRALRVGILLQRHERASISACSTFFAGVLRKAWRAVRKV